MYKMTRSLPSSQSSQRGSSLIEALVALLVLALGVLGIAGIQTRTLVESRTANSRAVAFQMADDLLDRMQANQAIRFNPPAVNPYVVTWGAPATAGQDCFASDCPGAELAAFDLRQWKTTLASLLPLGDAQVFQSPGDASQFGVLIGWAATQTKNEAQATDAAETALYTNASSVRDGSGAVGTGSGGVAACPANLICHLVYIRP
jgi:type IV pilus assembly protein PilV